MAAGTFDPKAAERRKKRLAIGLAALLAVVLFFQVPRILKQLNGSAAPAPAATTTEAGAAETPAPTDAPVEPVVATTLPRESEPPPAVEQDQLASLDRFSAKDPFVQQILPETAASTTPQAPAPTPPAPTEPAPPAQPRPPSAASKGRYAVVLAALPSRRGERAAAREAARIRRAGLPRIAVLRSADYRLMRAGYNVVYSGVYRSLRAARSAERSARLRGFRGAYTQQLSP